MLYQIPIVYYGVIEIWKVIEIVIETKTLTEMNMTGILRSFYYGISIETGFLMLAFHLLL